MININCYNKMMELDFIFEQIEDLRKKISTRELAVLNLQEECQHPIIFYTGDACIDIKNFSKLPKHFYCPLCGKRDFNLKFNPDGGNVFLIEKNFHYPDEKLKLYALTNIFKMNLCINPNDELEHTLGRLHNSHNIKYYKMEVIK